MRRSTFTVFEEIGRGYTGLVEEVWPGRHASSSVALKRLNEHTLRDTSTLARFRREASILERLSHPNIIDILESDLASDDPWFLMPLAECNLESRIPRGGMNDREIQDIFGKILGAVEYAHSENVLHRDLKPQNVLFVDGEVMVSDFGLGRYLDSQTATLTVTGFGGGTEGYTAPEQWIDFHRVDHRADVFALGSLLYHMVTGHAPLAGDRRAAPTIYRRVIDRCRRHEIEARFSSVTELRLSFEELWLDDSELLPPTERALQLIKLATVWDDDRDALISLYVQNSSDSRLHLVTIPTWDRELIESVKESSVDDLAMIVDAFCSHLQGHLDFESLDGIADFLALVFKAVDDMEIRETTLRHLLRIGPEFDRFYVGGLFARLVHGLRSRSDILMARDVLQADAISARWVSRYIRAEHTSPLIMDALPKSSLTPTRERS